VATLRVKTVILIANDGIYGCLGIVNFDWIASLYPYFEYLAFGKRLEKARLCHLPALCEQLGDDAKVLMVGDGDGRCLKTLLQLHPSLRVDYVELSKKMIKKAQLRVIDPAGYERVNWVCKDVREWEAEGYDALIGHFVLDCFDGKELEELVHHLHGKLKAGGLWIHSDFDPSVAWWAHAWTSVMYCFFWLVSGLRIKKLKRPDFIFESCSMSKCLSNSFLGGFVYSDLWRLK